MMRRAIEAYDIQGEYKLFGFLDNHLLAHRPQTEITADAARIGIT